MTKYSLWIEGAALAIEGIAALVILVFVVVATAAWLPLAIAARRVDVASYERYRQRLGRALLLGLELLVAADILRTVLLDSSVQSVLALALLVLVRTFLSWSLVLEIEGRWPWQPRGERQSTGRI